MAWQLLHPGSLCTSRSRAYGDGLVVAVVHVARGWVEVPCAGLRDALPVALASNVDVELVLAGLLRSLLAPGAGHKVIHCVPRLCEVEGNPCKLAGASALHVEDLRSRLQVSLACRLAQQQSTEADLERSCVQC